jgi:hypothetical protein
MIPLMPLMEVCELAPNELFYFCPSSLQRVSRGRCPSSLQRVSRARGRSMVPYCTCVGESRYHRYDTLFLGGEKSGMKSDTLVQRNKYQHGFYCDAIWPTT